MTDKALTREELVDEMTVLNEEADYHAERAAKLEERLLEATKLLRGWWGANYSSAYCLAMLKATQEFLIIDAGSSLET